tara:strand:+ start:206 stop:454 length:249 start_codon:yes stop_codon:yes gene_type:complete
MTIRRKIKRVVDGDTFETHTKLRGTNYIRIAGKNSPEKGERGYSREKNALKKLEGETVTLNPRGRSYNRVVADVRFKRRLLK